METEVAKDRVEKIVSEEEFTEEEMRERISEIRGMHEVGEALANLPTEFDVKGKKLRIASRTIEGMMMVDQKVIELMELLQPLEDVEQDELFQRVRERNRQVYDTLAEIVFRVVNEDIEKPEVSKEWIMKNVDCTDTGVAVEIMDAYLYHCTPVDLLKKTLSMRRF